MGSAAPRVHAGGLIALLMVASAATAHAAAPRAAAKAPITLESKLFKELSARSIGPANMGGRISDFAVVEKHPATVFAATGTGGVFKTTNQGVTWSAIFADQPVASIGAVAVWQKNPDVVWVGTGEANSRNSSSWGNGMYRSLDGGTSWTHVGLEATHNIARVVPDPLDSNTVYVAALGRLWGDNPERGVFKSSDGGKTWQHTLKVDAKTGACDLVMDPSDHTVLYAAMYSRKRTPWSYTAGGTSGGLFRSRDAGRTWTKLAGGLPASTGRIGLDVLRDRTGALMAVVESDEGGHLDEFESASRTGGVFYSEDQGEHWVRRSAWTPRPFYFSQIRVQPNDSLRVYLLGTDLWLSDDGGRTFRANGARNLHPDCHAMWIHPTNGDQVLLGTDGGIYLSHDRAANWDFINNLAIGEFYNVTADNRDPYWIYGGLQDNQSWGGPSRTRFEVEQFIGENEHKGILNDHWVDLGGGDGFHVQVDPLDPDIVYYESQSAYLARVNLRSGKERNLRPSNKEGEPRFRFNWNSPFQVSPHDPSVLWLGGNHLFKLTERGNRWELASPDLSTMDPKKMATGGSAAETHCTIVTLAESDREQGQVWAGTDDGKLWITHDGGAHWTDLTGNLKGVPAGLYMSRIEPSHHDPKVAYLAIDGHRTDDFSARLLMTRDGGKSWSSIVGDLPKDVPVKVVREDRVNPRLLFAGTERALFMSLDQGKHWFKPDSDLPTVAVDDLFIHAREHDLIIGTHGRSIYVLDDITPYQQWSDSVAIAPFSFFTPRPATAYFLRPIGGIWGQRMFSAKNPTFGATLNYFVREYTGDEVEITVADSTGAKVRTLKGPGTPGMHRVAWDLQADSKDRITGSEWNNPQHFVTPGRYKLSAVYGKAKPVERWVEVRVAPETLDP